LWEEELSVCWDKGVYARGLQLIKGHQKIYLWVK